MDLDPPECRGYMCIIQHNFDRLPCKFRVMDFFGDDSKTGIYRQKKTRSSQWIGLL